MEKSKDRKVWFVTRPQRDALFHKEALEALAKATEDFTVKWHGNRDAHKNYEQCLIDIGLKRDSISKDGSGGRTWAALLKTFCYCYTNSDGYLIPTKVGLALLKNENIRENITKQILTLQIPNAYFLEIGFRPKYNSDFSILPARFLIKLCTDSELDYYITKDEITFFVMTAKKDSELNAIVNKIKIFRSLSELDQVGLKSSISNEYDHRERSDKGARDYYKAHSDVAHTFMLLAEYTGLVTYERGTNSKITIQKDKVESVIEFLNQYDSRYPFNSRYLFSLERMAETNGLDINSYKATRYGNIKPVTNMKKKLIKAKNILSQHPSVSSSSLDELIEILSSEFSIEDSRSIAESLCQYNALSSIDEAFIHGVLNEENDREFEYKIGKILYELGFKVIMHPRYKNERTEIDILVKYGDNLCGIIDAKNYKNKFQLSSSLTSHMISEYIPNYINYDNCDLQFFGYVTANDIGGKANLNKITNKVENIYNENIQGFMINAKTLLGILDYCIENNIDKEKRASLVLKLVKNEAYTSFSHVENLIKDK
ncbi:AlwI family type II restriction endonuclease [Paraclostridium bifermentans]